MSVEPKQERSGFPLFAIVVLLGVSITSCAIHGWCNADKGVSSVPFEAACLFGLTVIGLGVCGMLPPPVASTVKTETSPPAHARPWLNVTHIVLSEVTSHERPAGFRIITVHAKDTGDGELKVEACAPAPGEIVEIWLPDGMYYCQVMNLKDRYPPYVPLTPLE